MIPTLDPNRENKYRALMSSVGNTPTIILCDRYAYWVSNGQANEFSTSITIPNNNKIVLKLEHLQEFSPTGSLYDRVYPWLFLRAERRRLIQPGKSHLIEGSVGNAGAAFAYTAKNLGYTDVTVAVPQDVYTTRKHQMLSLGAKLDFTPPYIGPVGYVSALESKAMKLSQERAKGNFSRDYILSKIRDFSNSPYKAFADEARGNLRCVFQESNAIDVFVAVVGSGNTLSKVGRYLKNVDATRIVAAEHLEQPFVDCYFRGGKPPLECTWSEQDFPATTIHGVPIEKLNLDIAIVDEVYLTSRNQRDDALGILNDRLLLHAGRTTGCAFAAAMSLTKRYHNKSILVPVFDGIQKYSHEGNSVCSVTNLNVPHDEKLLKVAS